ncbi:MAG: plasmid pRiA4b ORF-3 family protein [Gemmataceae bacterium]|nr:plasmid pRiA4b ORF-3 family protein [Gemmataceae bacterium]
MTRQKLVCRDETTPAQTRKPAKSDARSEKTSPTHLYTLEVFLLSGPIAKAFVKKNPVISRTIQMRGNQTLADLHHAIFDAYGREEEHMYEFQFGKGPMDPKGPRYVLPSAYALSRQQGPPAAGLVTSTTLDALGLKVGSRFGYWFDFGDDWWHQINVEGIEDTVPRGKYPKVTKRVGKSPPQYVDWDEEDE